MYGTMELSRESLKSLEIIVEGRKISLILLHNNSNSQPIIFFKVELPMIQVLIPSFTVLQFMETDFLWRFLQGGLEKKSR